MFLELGPVSLWASSGEEVETCFSIEGTWVQIEGEGPQRNVPTWDSLLPELAERVGKQEDD